VVGEERAIQGNLEPAVLLGAWERTEFAAFDVLRRAAGRPGHVFNLGHGVLPQTDPDVLTRLTELVRSYGQPA
jgi:uroporphyrinogen decarboxylase